MRLCNQAVVAACLLLAVISAVGAHEEGHEDADELHRFEWHCPDPCPDGFPDDCHEDVIEPEEFWYKELDTSLFTSPNKGDWDVRAHNTDEGGEDIVVKLLDAENFEKWKKGEDHEGCSEVPELNQPTQCAVVRGDVCKFRDGAEGAEDTAFRFVVIECVSDTLNCAVSYRIERFTDFEEGPCEVGGMSCGGFGGLIGGIVVATIIAACAFNHLRKRRPISLPQSPVAARDEGVDMEVKSGPATDEGKASQAVHAAEQTAALPETAV
eukprot:CAMPEP_0196753746 /NCGR_PEP_ID=MMETSP1091-20130531/91770_1 /TAXON_ID=302021 /ORGANISM="Rhodomonas sp., Strain CCMP768" /LENGTH=266 /DNA_ID=CAMNT_0042101901 /DNA_START=15 /DNA_END=815 /DNA_ORIENTATION=-